MMYKPIVSIMAALGLTMLLAGGALALSPGDPLLGDVFVTGFDGWTDMYPSQHGSAGNGLPNWGVLLTDDQFSVSGDPDEKSLIECSDGFVGTGGTNDGKFKPYVMVNTAYTTPVAYTISATLSAYDDDGMGLVFGYENYQNYLRVSFRPQATGSVGGSYGTSMQTIVADVITQIAWTNTAVTPYNGTTYDVDVTVDGSVNPGTYSVKLNGTEVLSGTHANITGNTEGHYGAFSWYQFQFNNTAPYLRRGGLTHSISITSTDGQTQYKSTDFDDAVPVAWRTLVMTNTNGESNLVDTLLGNFRQDFTYGAVLEDSNAYKNATDGATGGGTGATGNVDFLGPAVVVDEPDSGEWTNYEMAVRLCENDNDGIGLLVRVQDDDTFYRINFAQEGIHTDPTFFPNMYNRNPLGMSIQKCVAAEGGGAPEWTELFRDDQVNPEFLLTVGQPFDVKVTVVGNSIQVSVIDDPTGTPVEHNYDAVIDEDDPILSGSVGFATWGAGQGNLNQWARYGPYGGEAGAPLLTYVPEPSTLVLLGLLAFCGLGLRRRS